MNKHPIIEVVAGVLYNEHGDFLLSSRPVGKPYAGYWEFAGGKIEAGETKLKALQREFDEELGIQIHSATPWLNFKHNYEHAQVHLYFFRIKADQWSGTLTSKENQSWCWQQPNKITVSPLLPANVSILTALSIPTNLSGQLTKNFTGYQQDQSLFEAQYWQPGYSISTAANAIYVCLSDLKNALDQSLHGSVWVLCNDLTQWQSAQQVAALIWPIYSLQDLHNLQYLLKQGSNLPILALSDPKTIDQNREYLLFLGVHALIKDTTFQTN